MLDPRKILCSTAIGQTRITWWRIGAACVTEKQEGCCSNILGVDIQGIPLETPIKVETVTITEVTEVEVAMTALQAAEALKTMVIKRPRDLIPGTRISPRKETDHTPRIRMAPERVTARIIPLEMVEDHSHPIGDHIANPQVEETIARLRNLMVRSQSPSISGYQPNTPIEEVVCYYCRGKGHYKRLCPVMYREMQAHFQKGQI